MTFPQLRYIEPRYRKYAYVAVALLVGILLAYVVCGLMRIWTGELHVEISETAEWGAMPNVLICARQRVTWRYASVYGDGSTLVFVKNRSKYVSDSPDDTDIGIEPRSTCIQFNTSVLAPTFSHDSQNNWLNIQVTFNRTFGESTWAALTVWLLDPREVYNYAGFIEATRADADEGGKEQVITIEKVIHDHRQLGMVRWIFGRKVFKAWEEFKLTNSQVLSIRKPNLPQRSVGIAGKPSRVPATPLECVHLIVDVESSTAAVITKVHRIMALVSFLGTAGGYVSLLGVAIGLCFVKKYPNNTYALINEELTVPWRVSEELHVKESELQEEETCTSDEENHGGGDPTV